MEALSSVPGLVLLGALLSAEAIKSIIRVLTDFIGVWRASSVAASKGHREQANDAANYDCGGESGSWVSCIHCANSFCIVVGCPPEYCGVLDVGVDVGAGDSS